MTVSSAEEVTIIDLTDKDDAMYVDDKQGREKIVTSPSCSLTLSTVSNSNEREDEVVYSSVLQVQLELFNTYLNLKKFNNNGSFTVLEIRECFCKLSPTARASMSEVVTILKLLMVMPATNAVSKRSASALR